VYTLFGMFLISKLEYTLYTVNVRATSATRDRPHLAGTLTAPTDPSRDPWWQDRASSLSIPPPAVLGAPRLLQIPRHHGAPPPPPPLRGGRRRLCLIAPPRRLPPSSPRGLRYAAHPYPSPSPAIYRPWVGHHPPCDVLRFLSFQSRGASVSTGEGW
jgi:hypothetical protein